ncbi:MAG: hypothetical protein PHU80_01675 [Kiritimatiellae bacterium]|nr:hypothetical protein [Kiritimatiellia bacterium]
MKNSVLSVVVISAIFLNGALSRAQDTFLVTNQNTQTELTFTNTVGTASLVDGMIVFEGELVADFAVPAVISNDKLLASVQVVVQVKLFDELPSAEEIGTVQGAVLALNDDPNDPLVTTGTFYAYGASGWLQLTNSITQLPYETYENKTNIVTMIFDYTDSPITYWVDIGNPVPSDEVSQEIFSPVASGDGINSLSISGSGALEVEGVSSAGGSTTPLSLGMSLSVYYASNSVWATVSTVGENGHDPIRIFAKIGDKWLEVGVIENPVGESDNVYTVELNGLVPGESYMFRVEDETGHTFVLTEPLQVQVIQVGETAVETVMVMEMEMKMLSVVFNTEVGRRYQVKVSESLASGAWTVENIYIDGGFTEVFTASGTQTQIRIPINKNKAFFRIFMLED